MEGNTTKLQDIFFPVEAEKSKSLFPGFEFAEGITQTVYRTDTNKVLNHCSDAYSLVTNKFFMEPVYDLLVSRFGEKMIDTEVINIDDRKFYANFVIKSRPYNIQPGDIVNPAIKIQNSYDGKLKRGISMGWHRLICSNGMMAFEQESAIYSKHSSSCLDFNPIIKMVDKVDEQLGRFRKLTERQLTPKEIEELTEVIRERTLFPKKLIPSVAEVMTREQTELNTHPSAWLLYHGFNYQLNHADIAVHPEFKAKIDFQVLKEVENFLN